MGQLLKENGRSEGKTIIIDEGAEDEIRISFEDLPIQIRIRDKMGDQFYILGADDDGELHMIRDRDGGSFGRESPALPFAR